MQEPLLAAIPEDLLAPPPVEIDLDQLLFDAIVHHQAGREAVAERLYRTILAARSDNATASYNLGFLCNSQGRLQDAADAYRHAISVQPHHVEAYINLGTILLSTGQGEEAVAIYRQAIAISPQNAMALGNLGKALQDLGRVDDAIAMYREAISYQPDNVAVNANLGSALLDRKAWDESVAVTRHAISLAPDNAMALVNLGAALLKLGRHEEALVACRQAMALQPQSAEVQATLGGAMLELGAAQEAEVLCRQAIVLDPLLAIGYFNLSHAYKAMNRLEEAERVTRQAIALVPDSADYHFHLAHLLLVQGNLEAGWAEYEWRWKLADFAWFRAMHGPFPQPQWLGEDISDKTILIYTEQGLGDVIMFARYLPLVVQKAGHVIVAVHPSLRRLLETIEGITIFPIQDTRLPAFDVHCPLLSLPRAFATRVETIPAAAPYLIADPDERARWGQRLKGDRLRVGIVWAGNPITMRDCFRSPGLTNVLPVFAVPGVDFVVLQVGPGRVGYSVEQLPSGVLDLGAEVTDLTDTAAIMSNLDLMISSCTGPLHLAGALGVPSWAMIPFAPYFAWQLDSPDSRWYPSLRLYRQEQPGQDWSGVVGRIVTDLTELVRSRQDHALQSATAAATPVDAGDAPAAVPPGIPTAPMLDPAGFNELSPCRSGLMLFNRNDIYIGASLRKYGEFSAGETALFDIIVQRGMTILDIGANIGVHTVDLSRLTGPAGVVHAFEPQRLMFQVLCANVALNSCANVFTHHAAVGAAAGTLLVPYINPDDRDNYGGLSLAGAQRGEPVPLVTIDGLKLDACHIMKLDVEGMETEALQGAAETIRRFRPLLYVENDRANRSAELIGLLQSHGYRLYWHLPPLYNATNFRADPENIFGGTLSVNMLCIPSEIPQAALTNLREVLSPTDVWYVS